MSYELKPLSTGDLLKLMVKARDYYKGLNRSMSFDKEAATLLTIRAGGDARKLITACETCMAVSTDGKITVDLIDSVFPEKHIVFDNQGNEHYDLASAVQNSVQSSDANQAVYFLALWLASGEDPAYIARRILTTAFEDAGDNPAAISSAIGAVTMVERVGLPECAMALAHATILAAQSPRHKTAYKAINAALCDMKNGEIVKVPDAMRAGNGRYTSIVTKKYVERTIGSI